MKHSSLKKGMLFLTLGLVALVPSCRRRCYDCPPKCEETCYEDDNRYEHQHYGENAVVEGDGYHHKEYVEEDAVVESNRPAKKVRKSYNKRNGYNRKYVKEEVIEEQVLGDDQAPVEYVETDVQQAGAYPHSEYAQPAAPKALNEAPESLDQAFQFEQ